MDRRPNVGLSDCSRNMREFDSNSDLNSGSNFFVCATCNRDLRSFLAEFPLDPTGTSNFYGSHVQRFYPLYKMTN